MNLDDVMARLEARKNPEAAEGMARYGINPALLYGISMPALRELGKEIRKANGKDHALAMALWATGVHEARILASLVDDPRQVTEAQMEAWAADFDTWDVCDQVIQNLFGRIPAAWDKALAWSAREETFVKRAGFVLMARLAVTEKKTPDTAFLPFLPIIEREAYDGRNFVKKAVNWALRQIGKRSHAMNATAIEAAERIAQQQSTAARWVAADALRELWSEATRNRLKR